MKNKKGISLIVLVVTIIVIIILAGAVILSLTNNNPIEEANKARYLQDKEAVQSAITSFILKKTAEGLNITTVTPGTLATVANGVVTNGTDAKYTVPGGTATTFEFKTPGVNYIMKLPTYNATWKIDANAIVTVEIGGTTY
ncbi:MAG: hypothetical protein RR290_03175 [Clostridia bacterium]